MRDEEQTVRSKPFPLFILHINSQFSGFLSHNNAISHIAIEE